MRYTKEFCTRPFEEVEIHANGNVYTCCPNWNNFYSIGNIMEDSFEEVWNSPKAIEFREKILNNDYSLCDESVCAYAHKKFFESPYNIEYKPKMTEFPKIVKFAYDYECNIACKICREKVKRLSSEELEKLNSRIDDFFIPFLKSTDILIVNSFGDPFGSRHSRLLIKKAAAKYENLKFDFHTNGILCTEKNLKNLNITPDRIDKIRMSIHAASAQMYGKIVKNGEKLFPQIINNLEYLNEVRKQCFFPVFIHFVITSWNYSEIPDFILLAEKYNVSPRFWEFRQENCAYHMQENLYIYQKDHPLHNELLKVLSNPIVISNKQYFSPVFYDLIP